MQLSGNQTYGPIIPSALSVVYQSNVAFSLQKRTACVLIELIYLPVMSKKQKG